MRHKPVIGLNTDFHVGPTAKASCCYVWAGYFDSVARAGAVPILLPPIADLQAIHQMLDRVDGVVLVGGGDLDPVRDGNHRHPSMKLMPRRREDFDRMLAHAIGLRRIPVLAIAQECNC